MASITINLSESTYVSAVGGSHTSSTQLALFSGTIKRIIEKGMLGVGTTNSWAAAILKFAKPSAVLHKQISSAVLNTRFHGSQFSNYYGQIASFDCAVDYSLLDGNTVGQYGTIGQTMDYVEHLGERVDVKDMVFDVSSLLDFTGGSFSLILDGMISGAGNILIDGRYRFGYIVPAETTLTLTYEDVQPIPPTINYPKDTFLREAESVLFAWQYNSLNEATQTSAELNYRLQGASSWTVVQCNTESQYWRVDRLPAGAYEWRVRTTNDIGETSGWSEVANFNIVGKPPIPVIATPENKALTTITWTANGQQEAEIVLNDARGVELVHESIATGTTNYKPNMFLSGSYTFGVRVKNMSDLWSDWAYKTFTINAAGPEAAGIMVRSAGDNAIIDFEIPAGISAVLMRSEAGADAIILASLDALTSPYTDDTIKSGVQYTYTVRTYLNGFTDSAKRSITVGYAGSIFQSGEDKLKLATSPDQFLQHSENLRRAAAVNNYSGREFAMIERGEFTTQEVSKRFFVEFSDKAALDRMAKTEHVYYRDDRGNAFQCAIISVNYTEYMRDGWIAVINLIRTAESEVLVNV